MLHLIIKHIIKMDTLTFASSPMDTPCGLFFYLFKFSVHTLCQFVRFKIFIHMFAHILGQAMCKPFLNSCMLLVDV